MIVKPRGLLPQSQLVALTDQLDNLRAALGVVVDRFLEEVAKRDPTGLLTETESAVDGIIAGGQYLERFHGKRLLLEFYRRCQFSKAGFGQNAFLTELARAASHRPRARGLTTHAVNKIRLYVPAELVAMQARAGTNVQG